MILYGLKLEFLNRAQYGDTCVYPLPEEYSAL